jgi:hypothetical protein
MLGADPLVQAMLTEPLPFSALDAFVTTGSYAPKATALVVIVQFAATEAVTERFCVACPAEAAPPMMAALMPNNEASASDVARLLRRGEFMVTSLSNISYALKASRLLFTSLSV